MWLLVVLVIVIALAFAFQPTPQIPEPSAEDFSTATAKESSPVAVIFGTKDISSPNVTWFGDTKTEAVRKKGGK